MQRFEEIFMRSLTVNGYIVTTGPTSAVLAGFFEEIIPLIQQKKISFKEHRYLGLEQAGQAMRDLHLGGNTGKAVIIVADD